MNYHKIYCKLIAKRLEYRLTKVRSIDGDLSQGYYTETHHIIPLCMNGLDNKSNLVELTAREHFIAHKLLFFASIGTCYESKLSCAFWQMCYCSKDQAYKINKSSRQFNYERLLAIKAISKSMKGRIRINNNSNNKMIWPDELDNYLQLGWKLGGKPLSDKARISLSKKLKGKPHGPMSMEVKQKISKACKGYKFTDEQRMKLSQSLTGRQSKLKGRHISEETKEKISIASKGNQYALGKIAVNNGVTQKMVYPDQIPEGFVVGSLEHKLCSEEAKNKIRRYQSGIKCFTNGITTIRVHNESDVPEDFVRGVPPMSESRRVALSNALKGRKSPMKGKHHSKEVRKRIKETHIGRRHFTNGVKNIFCKPTDCPQGFYPGITMKKK